MSTTVSSAGLALATAVLVGGLQVATAAVGLVLARRTRRPLDAQSQQELSATFRGIRDMAGRMSAEDDVSEPDMEALKELVRSLPDLDFPDSVSRQRWLRRQRGSGSPDSATQEVVGR